MKRLLLLVLLAAFLVACETNQRASGRYGTGSDLEWECKKLQSGESTGGGYYPPCDFHR